MAIKIKKIRKLKDFGLKIVYVVGKIWTTLLMKVMIFMKYNSSNLKAKSQCAKKML